MLQQFHARVAPAVGGHCPGWMRRPGTLEGKSNGQGDAQDKIRRIDTCWEALVSQSSPELPLAAVKSVRCRFRAWAAWRLSKGEKVMRR
jgi:hypothetical protein